MNETSPHTAPLADEASLYLDAIDLSRALGLRVSWRSETAELDRAVAIRRRDAGAVRINGRRISFGP